MPIYKIGLLSRPRRAMDRGEEDPRDGGSGLWGGHVLRYEGPHLGADILFISVVLKMFFMFYPKETTPIHIRKNSNLSKKSKNISQQFKLTVSCLL